MNPVILGVRGDTYDESNLAVSAGPSRLSYESRYYRRCKCLQFKLTRVVRILRIDAHQHYWKLNRGDYTWLRPDNETLYKDFLPNDLKPHLETYGIQKTIVVQAAPSIAESEFLLSLAEQEPTIAGVVGWLDLESDDFTKQFEEFRKHSKFVGIRPMLQDLKEDDWILKDRVLENITVLANEGFPIDILIFPRHLPHIVRLFERVPNLTAVIDHLGKPHIKEQIFEPWQKYIFETARNPNVMCKLSGMVTEADHVNWHLDDLSPYVDYVLNVFGVNRVMFGSDWPVCALAADYGTVYRTLHDHLLAYLSAEDLTLVFGTNAIKFYGLRE